ncbi:hypothetical protein N7478_002530 [Penicillium angulare]|uniref:uncharacterized protein n=1 Tax=Penicillium angulare TaxID=116970 RepID=UPI002540D9CD|nr:uncharacterized protein N7478_002530 [Penicillium angulare]KAJ5286844.1 hypothetical protein N7478_002530 [Penicillium angulare]
MLPRHPRGRGGFATRGPPRKSPSPSPSPLETNEFFPSLLDVLKVRYTLQWKLREGFPVELIDEIIDDAEYWPSTEHHMEEGDQHTVIGTDRDQVLLKTVPLCYDRKNLEQPSPKQLPHRGSHPCRKIVFHLSSHDQGSSGSFNEEMYSASWTWFDIEVIRGAHKRNMYVNGEEQELLEDERGHVRRHFEPNDELLLPRQTKLQVNGKHVRKLQNNTIVWHYLDDIQYDSHEAHEIERTKGRGQSTLDGQYVRDLEVGDSIALWARARFPGWTNHVYRARVRVFWAV